MLLKTGRVGRWPRLLGEIGLKPSIDGLRIDPCIPRQWKTFSVHRMFRGRVLEITVDNPSGLSKGVKRMDLDGKTIEGNVLPESALSAVNRVRVVLEE